MIRMGCILDASQLLLLVWSYNAIQGMLLNLDMALVAEHALEYNDTFTAISLSDCSIVSDILYQHYSLPANSCLIYFRLDVICGSM